MKKIILGTLTLFIFQFTQAQEPVGFSFLAGTNIANFKTTDFKASSAGPGLFAGIGFNMGYHETYNYQMEIVYAQNSINLENNSGNEDKYDVGGSIQLGLYLNYYIIKPEEDKFYFGPQFGVYTTYGKTTASTGEYSGDEYQPSGISSIELLDAPVFNYGTGIGLTGAYNKFRFNLRYNLGLSNVLRTFTERVEAGDYPSDVYPYSGKLSSISFTLSYRFFSRN